MILDTSAVIAILKQEPEALRLLAAIESATDQLSISAGSAVELAIVGARTTPPLSADECAGFLKAARVEIAPVDGAQVALAWAGFARYGKGRHPAGLNFGDCFAYALAKATGSPLLFKGNDFGRTDVAVAPW